VTEARCPTCGRLLDEHQRHLRFRLPRPCSESRSLTAWTRGGGHRRGRAKGKQILLNLLSNAVKFTPEGGRGGLTVTAAEGVVTTAVTDTGVGIAPEDQAAIFEEFRQVGRDDTRKQEGTGLGLTLAKKFVELHGGRIGVESQVGQGSTFTFTLPVRPWPTSAS
jgi:signal transduction histidine kinase